MIPRPVTPVAALGDRNPASWRAGLALLACLPFITANAGEIRPELLEDSPEPKAGMSGKTGGAESPENFGGGGGWKPFTEKNPGPANKSPEVAPPVKSPAAPVASEPTPAALPPRKVVVLPPDARAESLAKGDGTWYFVPSAQPAPAPVVITPPPVAPVVLAARPSGWETSLDKLAGGASRADLRLDRPDARLEFGLAPKDMPGEATLALEWNCATLFHPGEAELEVRLNGRVVARLPFGDGVLGHSGIVTLPAEAFKPGRNALEFHASVRDIAQAPKSLPLAQIALDESRLSAAVTAPVRITGSLAGLGSLFHARPGKVFPAHIAIPQAPPLTDAFLTAGALVTQGVRLHLGATPHELTFGARLRRDRMNILIGTREHIAGFLPPGASPPPAGGPTLALYSLPDDAFTPLLVITGGDEAAVRVAAGAFAASRDFGLPEASAAQAAPPAHYPATGKPGAASGPYAAVFGEPVVSAEGDTEGLRVQLTDGDSRSVLATWEFLGHMAVARGHAFPRMKVSFNPASDGTSRLVVGLVPQLPWKELEGLPARRTAGGLAFEATPARRSAAPHPSHAGDAFLGLFQTKTEKEKAAKENAPVAATRPTLTWSFEAADFTGCALLFADRRASLPPTLVLTASDSGVLLDGVTHLAEVGDKRFGASGKVMLWADRSTAPTVVAEDTPAAASEEKESPWWDVTAWWRADDGAFVAGPIVIVVGALLVIFLAAFLVNAALRRTGRSRAPAREEDAR